MKLFVQPEGETDDEYKNEANDDFRPYPQQPSQPADHGLEKNRFEKDKDTSINNYKSECQAATIAGAID